MTKQEVLKEIKKIDKENNKLFTMKAKLEDEILAIDIQIYHLMDDYHSLVGKIINK